MPFQPINFANIAPQGNEFLRDFTDTISKGYQAGQLPSKLDREKRKQESDINAQNLAAKMSEEL